MSNENEDTNLEQESPLDNAQDGSQESPSGEVNDGIDELTEIRQHYQGEINDLKNALQRERAEFTNYRKRAQGDRLAAQQQAAFSLLEKLMPVFDSFDQLFTMKKGAAEPLTLDKFFEGASIIQKQMWDAFSEAGLSEIDPLGQPYDANSMEAIGIEEGDVDHETVTAVYQKGYIAQERVLRPARVVVTKPKPPVQQEEKDNN